MQNENAHEIVLEAEFCNSAAIELYTNLGFIKTKLLSRYYLNGSDAYRLKLALKPPNPPDDLYNPKREQKSSTGGNLSDSE
jgi:peptide alpha-N-acetyltransferase